MPSKFTFPEFLSKAMRRETDAKTKARLINGIDYENMADLQCLCADVVSGAVKIAQTDVDEAFVLALHTREDSLVRWFLTDFLKPSTYLINQCFEYYSTNGQDPEILEILQGVVSPNILAEGFRSLRHFDRYLVDVSESVDLKELETTLHKLAHKPTGVVRSRKSSILMELRCCSIIQEKLLDSVFSKRNWFVVKLIKSMHRFVPDPTKLQTVINKAFEEAVKRHLFALADIIAFTNRRTGDDKTLQIDQDGFDSAVVESLHRLDKFTLEWLLSGRIGFMMTESVIAPIYRDCNLRNVRAKLQYELNANGVLVPIAFKNSRDYQTRTEQLNTLQTITTMLRSRLSPELIEKGDFEAEAEKKLIELKKRKERVRQQLQRRTGYADIHAFAGQRISDPVALRPAAAATADGDNQDNNGNGNGEMDMDVPNGEADPENMINNTPKSLNNTILAYMNSRIDQASAVRAYPDLEAITLKFVQLINDEFSDDRREDEAMRVISSVLATDSVPMFRTTLFFLDSLPAESRRESISLWLAGFVSESIREHSCRAGMLERAVTGLRGINDPALNRIFARVEAPHLIRTFLTSVFNIYDRREGAARQRHIAEILKERGVNAESTEEEVQAILVKYAQDSIREYDDNIAAYEEEISVMVEVVIDGFEDVKPLLR